MRLASCGWLASGGWLGLWLGSYLWLYGWLVLWLGCIFGWLIDLSFFGKIAIWLIGLIMWLAGYMIEELGRWVAM